MNDKDSLKAAIERCGFEKTKRLKNAVIDDCYQLYDSGETFEIAFMYEEGLHALITTREYVCNCAFDMSAMTIDDLAYCLRAAIEQLIPGRQDDWFAEYFKTKPELNSTADVMRYFDDKACILTVHKLPFIRKDAHIA